MFDAAWGNVEVLDDGGEEVLETGVGAYQH